MKKDTSLRTVVLLIVLALCALSLFPTLLVFTKSADPKLSLELREREIYKKDHPKIAAKSMNLGLDLAGGTHIIVEIDKSKLSESEGRDVLDRCLEILRNRVDQYGLSEPIITKSGDNRIVADLAGMDAEGARRLIGATALLEFKLIPEPQEFKPVLDRMDAFLAARGKGKPGDTSSLSKPASPAETMFGRVVQNDTTGAKDTVASLTDTAGTKDSGSDTTGNDQFLKNRPFSALLAQVGRDIGVLESNIEKMRRLLADPEVQKIIPTRFQFLWGRDLESQKGGQKIRRLYLLKRRAEMTGATIADANFSHAQGGLKSGEIEVGLTFKDLGPKEFARVTGANIGRQLAIVLDSVVYSAPVIQGRIPNGRASITGVGDITEAKQLAVTLRAGSLPAPMKIAELRSVGPSLGEENIKKGLYAALGALALVGLFMMWYYRLAGVIANVALVLNMIIIFSVLSAFHATLTLPGLAGIALTIGMAVDANVLIFERIREEMRSGKPPHAAVDIGYKKAFSAIFDSNLTTVGTALILYYVGVGPIKGFGLSLTIGLGASMYTAIVVTRLIFDFILTSKEAKELSIGHGLAWFHKVDLKVIGRMRIYVGFSVVAILLSIGILATRGLNLGIDFTGGNVYQIHFKEKPDLAGLRLAVEGQGLKDPKIQTVGALGENRVLIYLADVKNDSAALNSVQSAIGSGEIETEDTVGPSVGKDLRMSAFWSIFASWILIIVYIWFRFGRNGLGFGLGGVIALVHDCLITLGIYALLGREISLQFVAAILTIIGFSINDSIVIFDRIRELTGMASLKESFSSHVNAANNQCLSRGIITNLTVFFTVVVLAVLGASEVRDFSIAMIIGVLVGTYSTVSVASPFVTWWDSRRLRVK